LTIGIANAYLMGESKRERKKVIIKETTKPEKTGNKDKTTKACRTVMMLSGRGGGKSGSGKRGDVEGFASCRPKLNTLKQQQSSEDRFSIEPMSYTRSGFLCVNLIADSLPKHGR
jgi:hypothetical protein